MVLNLLFSADIGFSQYHPIEMDWNSISYGQSNSLVCHEPVVTEFCLQNGTELVDLCPGCCPGFRSRLFDCKLAKLAGGEKESCRVSQV